MFEEADFVITGGGSAGCATAARLSENPENRVVLLEAGGSNKRLLVDVPAGLQALVTKPENYWMYFTEPDASQNDRCVFWSSGLGLGGGSAINGMVYIRGATYDYDHWANELGCTGWSWDEVLPFFRKSEDFDGPESPYHGKGGPLGVSRLRAMHPLAHAFMDVCKDVGMRQVEDYCAGDIDGTFVNLATQRGGKRCSTAEGFLKPALKRPNLRVITGAAVDRILFDGKRACGVRFHHAGAVREIRVNREVVVSAGTIQTPAILMRSGVGPGSHLQEKGVALVAARQQVGRNLHEHPSLPNSRLVNQPTYNVKRNPFILGREGLKYIFTRSGWLSTCAVHAMAHVRSDPDLAYPDIKYQMMPFWTDATVRGYFAPERPVPDAASHYGITIGVNLMTPKSRGRILLRDKDPASRPMIDFRIYDDASDLDRMRKGLKFANTIFAAPSLAKHVKGASLSAGSGPRRRRMGQPAARVQRNRPASGRNMPDGQRWRGGRRYAIEGQRGRERADRRLLDHSAAALCQHQCARDHDWRALHRLHSRQPLIELRPGGSEACEGVSALAGLIPNAALISSPRSNVDWSLRQGAEE